MGEMGYILNEEPTHPEMSPEEEIEKSLGADRPVLPPIPLSEVGPDGLPAGMSGTGLAGRL